MTKTIYNRKDFSNENDVRWCPGCGDYAILAALQKALPAMGLPPEKHVFISGIGCAGRLPYYMNAYGLHTIHGRAPAVATGLKALQEDVCVWVITGDGDALSIGGNHLIHSLRRNVNVNVLLINNQVYGLTKGQFSPTSKEGQITKTSPQGVSSQPINPLSLALSAGATFVARAVDKDPNHLAEVLKQANEHIGCSFVEIYQDCHIFNPGAFDAFTQKNNRAQNTVLLKEGAPLLYGAEEEFALDFDGANFVKKASGEQSNYRHNPADFISAVRLSRLAFPDYPVPLGIYYQTQKPAFKLKKEIKKTKSDLMNLFKGKAYWNS